MFAWLNDLHDRAWVATAIPHASLEYAIQIPLVDFKRESGMDGVSDAELFDAFRRWAEFQPRRYVAFPSCGTDGEVRITAQITLCRVSAL